MTDRDIPNKDPFPPNPEVLNHLERAGHRGGAGTRIPITVDLDEDAQPAGDADPMPDPTTVQAIKVLTAPQTVAQLQEFMRTGGGDLNQAVAELVAMGHLMWTQLTVPDTECWIYRGNTRQEIRMGPE